MRKFKERFAMTDMRKEANRRCVPCVTFNRAPCVLGMRGHWWGCLPADPSRVHHMHTHHACASCVHLTHKHTCTSYRPTRRHPSSRPRPPETKPPTHRTTKQRLRRRERWDGVRRRGDGHGHRNAGRDGRAPAAAGGEGAEAQCVFFFVVCGWVYVWVSGKGQKDSPWLVY